MTDWERRQRADMAPFIEARRIDRENIQARIKALRGKYGKAKRNELAGIADEIKELSDSVEPELVSPQIWGARLHTGERGADHGAQRRTVNLLAEGGVLDTLGGRNSGGKPYLFFTRSWRFCKGEQNHQGRYSLEHPDLEHGVDATTGRFAGHGGQA